MVVAILSGLFRLLFALYLVFKLTSLTELINNFKKPVYRFLEFFYKACMYPLLFFAFMQFGNWSPLMLVDSNRLFSQFTRWLAVAVLVAYFVVTTCQVRYEQVSRLNRIENATEFYCDCLAAMIIALSVFSTRYLLVLAVIVPRGVGYVLLRREILRDFRPIEYFRLLSLSFEVASIVCTLMDSFAVTGALIICAVVCQLVHTITIVFLSDHQAMLEKHPGDDLENESGSRPPTETHSTLRET